MNTINTKECYNALLSQKLIEEFKKRNMEGLKYVADKDKKNLLKI